MKKAVFAGAVLLILLFTMKSQESLGIGTKPGGINTKFFHSIQTDFSTSSYLNTVGNIILFIPYGLSLGLIFKGNHLIKAGAAGALFSLVIEFIQLFMPNRWTDIDDVLLNTIGTLLGCMVALFWINRDSKQ